MPTNRSRVRPSRVRVEHTCAAWHGWLALALAQRAPLAWRLARGGVRGEAVWLRRSRQWCPNLHAAVSAVIGRAESGPTGSVCGSVGAPRGGGSANQMSPLLPAHRTTPTLPIYSVLAVAAVVPSSHSSTDFLCRDYCNPYDVVNTGMVHVHRRSRVDDAGGRPRLSDGIRVDMRRK